MRRVLQSRRAGAVLMAGGMLALAAGVLVPPDESDTLGMVSVAYPFPLGRRSVEQMHVAGSVIDDARMLGLCLVSTWSAKAWLSTGGGAPEVPIGAAEVERRLHALWGQEARADAPGFQWQGGPANPDGWRADPSLVGLVDTLAAGGTRRVMHWRNIAEMGGMLLGPLAAMVGAVPFVRSLWRLRVEAKRTRAGLCPGCGYDLRGSVGGACPECGRNEKARSPGPSSLKWRQGDSNP